MSQRILRRFEVVVEPAGIERTMSAHFGQLEVRVGDECFPAEGWTDFVVVVLGWLARAAATLHENSKIGVDFMDGPFDLQLTALGDLVQVRGGTRNLAHGSLEVFDEVVDRGQMVQAILLAGDAVLAVMDAEDGDRDLLALRASLDDLR